MAAKIVSINYALTDLCISLGVGGSLVGVSHPFPSNLRGVDVVAEIHPNPKGLLEEASGMSINWELIRSKSPTHFLFDSRGGDEKNYAQLISSKIPVGCQIVFGNTQNLTRSLESYEQIGKKLQAADKGRMLAQKLKAQLLDWGNSFYDRMKSKRVLVLSSIQPVRAYGGWIGEVLRLVSTDTMEIGIEREITFKEMVDFNPHVLIVAPDGYSFLEAKKTFLYLEKQPGWEDMWATKRGEVYFTAGTSEFYSPGPNVLINAGSIIISAIAGLESGYISPKDSFVRMRTLEMFRHTLK